ncbi:adenylate/guanylate cyclase domain-containing protein [Pseudonocardia oroxyli]|uniref:Adenylate cyclase n=1 Tax=Pseudonocardia oroxyli TaxID=366584 RepID=A0A1G7PJZ2_PSEOR|nr:adenylate/guanylate cyclase domain-containing protein [Pseudonocardia oroxyli]SDF86528.1 adenylate cyclase [Pseudonocardia oroxyli]
MTDPALRPGGYVLGLSVRLLLAVSVVVANFGGAAIVFALSAWVVPQGQVADVTAVRLLNTALVIGYLLLATPVGILLGRRIFRLRGRAARRDPGRRARRIVLYGPLRLVVMLAVLWGGAVVLFGLVNLRFSWRLALSVAETITVGGIATVALSYLLSERILRGPASVILAGQPPRSRALPGVLLRPVLFWALGTAVPVIGLLLGGVSALVFQDVTVDRLAVMILAIGTAALFAGILTTIGAARAAADPVIAVRRAMQRVEQGDLEVSVPVYDHTELGRLQAGFNTMVEGLRERERIRDLFGRHVGEDVARAAAAADGSELGGEVRRVAVLFVDLVGSTAMAAERPPAEVVDVLNRFFAIVVESVERHGGWINKFEGDAALAVFGAPTPVRDPAGCALAAARELADQLAARMPETAAGIGVSAGDAVAGNVGDPRRYEYTVIGDPVNEAARLTDLAKSRGGVVASGAALDLADEAESQRWVRGEPVVLRGRNAPTEIATPRAELNLRHVPGMIEQP